MLGRARAIKIGAFVAGIVVVAVAAGLAIGGGDFLRQHWGALLGASALVAGFLTLVAKMLVGLGRAALALRRRRMALGEQGAAFAEFVIVIIPFMLTLTALMQLALASMARVLVSYSAFCAARAAIVLIPTDSTKGSTNPFAPLVGKEQSGKIGWGANSRIDIGVSKKAAWIRNAAAYPLIAASPAIDTVIEDTVNNWGAYMQGRLQGGLSVSDVFLDMLSQSLAVPQKMASDMAATLQADMQGGLATAAQKAKAKADMDAYISQLPASQQAGVRAQVDSYIDSYKGGSAGGQILAGVAGAVINDVVVGGLSQFRGQLEGMVGQGVTGNVGGNFGGYAVNRALDDGFGQSDGVGGAMLRTLRKLIYARIGTVVTFVDQSGAVKTAYGSGDPVTAKVTYLFYCQIPLANKIAGKPYYDLPLQTQLDMTTGSLGYASAIGIPGYFMALTAEHTLTVQGK